MVKVKGKISTQAKWFILPELILFPTARGLSKYCYSPWMGCQQIKVYTPTLYHVCPMIFQCSSVLQGRKSKVRAKCLPQKIQHNGITWSWNPDFTTVERIMQLLCLLPSVTFLAEMERGNTICITTAVYLSSWAMSQIGKDYFALMVVDWTMLKATEIQTVHPHVRLDFGKVSLIRVER